MTPHPLTGVLLLVAALPAQAPLPQSSWRVPLHGDTPAHAKGYGLWAAGDSFKTSFHDGMAFYPVLGTDAPRNLPVTWRTRSVERGTRTLAVDQHPALSHGLWRVEFAHAGFREAYEVRAEGVEQSFVFATLPEGPGDLVVRGQVTSELTVDPVEPAWQALLFRDADRRPIVRYGAALAFDADGDVCAVTTACDGQTVELRVPDTWLEDARLPITIDPLTQAVSLPGTSSQTIGTTAVQHHRHSPGYNLMFAVSRFVSATDQDLYAYLSDGDFGRATLVYSDLLATGNEYHPTITYVPAASRWLLAYQREVPATNGALATILVHYHDNQNLTPGSGLTNEIPPLMSVALRNPALGGVGATDATEALLVYTKDITANLTDTNLTDVMGVPVSATTRTIRTGATWAVGGGPVGTSFDRGQPAINQSEGTSDGALIVYSEFDHLIGQGYDIRGERVAGNAIHGWQTIALGGGFSYLLQPRVAGAGSLFRVSYGRTADRRSTALVNIATTRVAWMPRPTATLLHGPVVATGIGILNLGIAWDSHTHSHWGLVYSHTISGFPISRALQAVRVGLSGGVTEAVAVQSSSMSVAHGGAIAFDAVTDAFPIVYGRGAVASGTRFVYSPLAALIPYGTGCGAANLSANEPYAGNSGFRVQMGPTSSTVGLLMVALQPGSIPLDGIGMPGCTFLLDPVTTFATLVSSSPLGGHTFNLHLPDLPVVTGDLFAQGFYPQASANPAGLVATRGLEIRVR